MKKILIAPVAVLVTLLSLFPVGAVAAQVQYNPQVPITESTTKNWSGYVVETSLTSPATDAVSDVYGEWTVPTVTASSKNTYSSIWVGIDGWSSPTVEQIGIDANWINGAESCDAWYEMYPNAPVYLDTISSSYIVNPGDDMTGEVYFDGDQFVLTLNDITEGWESINYSTSTTAEESSAEWIVEAPSQFMKVLPLADFDTATFTSASATINDTPGTISSWANDSITMKDGSAIATPSALSTDGSSFSVTYSTSSGGGSGSGSGHGHGHGKP